MDNAKRLYKYREKEMIGGVCAGIADYFKLDVTIVRLGMVLLGLMWGAGVFLYIVAMIIMPDKSEVISKELDEADDDDISK
jgi:phage shock protein C